MAQDGRTEIIERIAESRLELSEARAALRKDWDFPAKARRHVLAHRWEYLGGVAVLGALVFLGRSSSRPAPARWLDRVPGLAPRNEVPKQAGAAAFLLGAAKIAFDLARPALTKWLKTEVERRTVN